MAVTSPDIPGNPNNLQSGSPGNPAPARWLPDQISGPNPTPNQAQQLPSGTSQQPNVQLMSQAGRNISTAVDPGADPNGLDPGQIANIKTIIGVGKALGMGQQAIITAIAVADDESNFQNYANANDQQSLNYPHEAVGHDHASVGVFQQQVGYGWGNYPEIMNVAHQAMAFFGASSKANAPGMLQQQGWQTMDPGALAQQIQQSGTPDAYYPLVEFARKAYSAFANAPAVKLPVPAKAHGPYPVESPTEAGVKAALTSAVKGGNQQQVNTAMTSTRSAQSKLNMANPATPPKPPAPPPPPVGRNTGPVRAM